MSEHLCDITVGQVLTVILAYGIGSLVVCGTVVLITYCIFNTREKE